MRFYFLLFFIFLNFNCFAQINAEKDSALFFLKKEANDSTRIEILKNLCSVNLFINVDSCIYFSQLGLRISETIKDSSSSAFFLDQAASAYHRKSDYSSALSNYFKASKLSNEKAISGYIYNSIGNVYREMNQLDNAEKYYRLGLELREETNDTAGMASGFNNLGIIYMMKAEYEKGMEYWKKSLDIKLRSGDEKGASSTMNNMAMYYRDIGKMGLALDYFNKVIEINMRINYNRGIALAYGNIGEIYLKKKDYKKALGLYLKGLDYAILDESKFIQAIALENLSICSFKLGNYKDAYEYHLKYTSMKEITMGEESQKQAAELEKKYEGEKKQMEIKKLSTEQKADQALIAAQNEEVKRQNIQKFAFAGGFSLMLILAFVIFRSYRLKKRDNEIILFQKDEVELQKQLVDEKNKEIVDSINYAKRLQEAILPPLKYVRHILPESFIFYKPKDIVAGDFYWMEDFTFPKVVKTEENFKQDRRVVLLAAADCTGHGVPGAIVSVVCSNALNRAVKEFGITEPGKILDKVRELVIETFEKSESEVKDGMDISLMRLDLGPLNDLSDKKWGVEIQWAGAYNPLWIVRKEATELEEIKADKQPIGKMEQMKPFVTHRIQLNKGDHIYMFTDGFADQFGGEKGKKFKTSNFRKLLLSIKKEPMEKQHALIESAFSSWKGQLEQIDDVCVIGISF